MKSVVQISIPVPLLAGVPQVSYCVGVFLWQKFYCGCPICHSHSFISYSLLVVEVCKQKLNSFSFTMHFLKKSPFSKKKKANLGYIYGHEKTVKYDSNVSVSFHSRITSKLMMQICSGVIFAPVNNHHFVFSCNERQ